MPTPPDWSKLESKDTVKLDSNSIKTLAKYIIYGNLSGEKDDQSGNSISDIIDILRFQTIKVKDADATKTWQELYNNYF